MTENDMPNTANNIDETTQLLNQFHQQYPKPKTTHADGVLSVCAVIYIIVGCIGCLLTFEFLVALAAAFGVFTSGVFMYVVAQIYKNIRELNER